MIETWTPSISTVAIVGGGGAGLRAAIAAAEADPKLRIALLSKVYPMRSHTVAAEGGSAGVVRSDDSLEHHFNDTVSGGDWLCDQDVVDYFVAHCTEEMTQLEHWGCPWSRKEDGHVNVRAFGGMKIERTWFAADRTGFHMLHTLFQTSMKYPSIQRFDEHFCCDLVVDDGRCQGVVAIEIATGEFKLIRARAVIIATGGAGRVFRQNTNGGIVTGDGMALAYRHGVPLRDMEFVQYHPTCMPGTGLLFTEGCRGEGGILTNKDGYRYLQDYGLGPPDPWPRKKAMELGPRDRLSQAFWHEQRKGRTVTTAFGRRVREPRPAQPRHAKLRERPAADLRARRGIPRHRPGDGPDSGAPRGALHDGGHTHERADGLAIAGALRRGRVRERGHSRGQPPGLEFAGGALRFRKGRRRAGGKVREAGSAAGEQRAPCAGRGSARARRGDPAPSCGRRTGREGARRDGEVDGARLRHLSARRRDARDLPRAVQPQERVGAHLAAGHGPSVEYGVALGDRAWIPARRRARHGAFGRRAARIARRAPAAGSASTNATTCASCSTRWRSTRGEARRASPTRRDDHAVDPAALRRAAASASTRRNGAHA
jgi:hypothetical protein